MTAAQDEARELVGKMTLAEKASLLSGKDYWHLEGIEHLGIPEIAVSDGPHGLRKQDVDPTDPLITESVPATCFPPSATTACSFDRRLLYDIGSAIGEECRANDVALVLGPGINIKRSPLCGRNFEYFSEDPYLAGELGSAYVKGVQNQGVGTSVKHFAANNQETRRMTVESVVDERALHEIYLPAFEKVVTEAHPWSVMCSYNRLRADFSDEGEDAFASENRGLLTDILRRDWHFDGLVVSDWGAVNDRLKGLAAGLDLEMPGVNDLNKKAIVAAVGDGTLDEHLVDMAAERIVRVILKAAKRKPFDYDVDTHHELALKAAAMSAVLLKNDDALLPGDVSQKAAVIGEFARKPRYQGAGSSKVNSTRLDDALDAFSAAGLDFEYAPGYSLDSDGIDQGLIDEACMAACGKDIVYVFAGLPDSYESEGFDRTDLRLPTQQIALIEALHSTNDNLVVVLSAGSVIDLSWEDQAKSVLMGYLGGQAGGRALVELLLGKRCPGGKLAESWPMNLEDNPSYAYFPGGSRSVEYRESIFVGYRYYDTAVKDVRYPFGYGLSYTTFKLGQIHLSSSQIIAGDKVTVNIDVSNTGKCAGDEVVQLYISNRCGGIPVPEQELKGFERVHLEPGQTKVVTFTCTRRAFSHYDAHVHDWCVQTGEYSLRIGTGSRAIAVSAKLNIVSTDPKPLPLPESEGCYADLSKGLSVSDEAFRELYGRPLPKSDREPGDPHTTNSTMSEITDRWVGRIIYNKAHEAAVRTLGGDPQSASTIDRMIDEAPLRSVLMLKDGGFTPEKLQGVVDMLNGHLMAGLVRYLRG